MPHLDSGKHLCFFTYCLRLDVPESGLAALVRLSNGDMRKALNILQVHFNMEPFKHGC